MLEDKINRIVIDDIQEFWIKVLDAFDYRAGLSKSYNHIDPAIKEDTEYFGPNVTMDDRLRYIGNYLSINPEINDNNKVLNFIITHFYGGRDCHRIINAELNPFKAHINFEEVLKNKDYVNDLRKNIDIAIKHNYSIWSNTELHSSLQGAMNKHANTIGIFDKHPINMITWLASWIKDGTVDKILECKSLKECVSILCEKPGIGPYYGYHGATDQSTNPSLPFHHDEPFVLPGPGCQRTLRQIFPGLAPKGELVVWLRERTDKYFPKIKFNEYWHNIEVNGKKVYSFEQNTLTCYTMEVALCQYGVYQDIKQNPEKEIKRKIKKPNLEPIIEAIKLSKDQNTLENFL